LGRPGIIFSKLNKREEPLQAFIWLCKTKRNCSDSEISFEYNMGLNRLDKRNKGLIFARDDTGVIWSQL